MARVKRGNVARNRRNKIDQLGILRAEIKDDDRWAAPICSLQAS